MDMSFGSVFIEVPIFLSAESGRDKHTNLEIQGEELFAWFCDFIKDKKFDGANFGPIKYWGTNRSLEGKPVRIFE